MRPASTDRWDTRVGFFFFNKKRSSRRFYCENKHHLPSDRESPRARGGVSLWEKMIIDESKEVEIQQTSMIPEKLLSRLGDDDVDETQSSLCSRWTRDCGLTFHQLQYSRILGNTRTDVLESMGKEQEHAVGLSSDASLLCWKSHRQIVASVLKTEFVQLELRRHDLGEVHFIISFPTRNEVIGILLFFHLRLSDCGENLVILSWVECDGDLSSSIRTARSVQRLSRCEDDARRRCACCARSDPRQSSLCGPSGVGSCGSDLVHFIDSCAGLCDREESILVHVRASPSWLSEHSVVPMSPDRHHPRRFSVDKTDLSSGEAYWTHEKSMTGQSIEGEWEEMTASMLVLISSLFIRFSASVAIRQEAEKRLLSREMMRLSDAS